MVDSRTDLLHPNPDRCSELIDRAQIVYSPRELSQECGRRSRRGYLLGLQKPLFGPTQPTAISVTGDFITRRTVRSEALERSTD